MVNDNHEVEFVETEELVVDEVKLQELERAEALAEKEREKHKHNLARKGDVKAKKRTQKTLGKDVQEVYGDNPDKYINKKVKKTLKVRQNKKHVTNKREREEAKEIERKIKNGLA